MKTVTLREVTQANFLECIRLEVAPDQSDLVAPNVYSLAQAKVNPRLTPLAVYDGRIVGREPGEDDQTVGFVMS
jgi:diamine N-acetyltransferase